MRASGLTVDAFADRETAAPGESLRVTVQTYLPVADPGAGGAATSAGARARGAGANGAAASPRLRPASTAPHRPSAPATARVVKLGAASVKAPAGWEAAVATGPAEDTDTSPFARFFRETPTRSDAFSVKVAKDAPFTTPYWLAKPRKGNVFEWDGVDAATKNLPFAAPVATAELAVEIGGQAVTVKRPVEYRYADSIRGEIRRPFTIVPGLTVAFDSKLEIVPIADLGKPRRVAVRLQNQTLRNPEGTVSLKLPAGWKSEPAQAPFALKARGEKTAVFFTVTPAPGTAAGSYELSAEAVSGDQTYRTALRMIEYPHIQTHRLYDPAVARRARRRSQGRARARRLCDGQRRSGAGRDPPHGAGCHAVERGPVVSRRSSRFDTIVVGVRASESRPEFVVEQRPPAAVRARWRHADRAVSADRLRRPQSRAAAGGDADARDGRVRADHRAAAGASGVQLPEQDWRTLTGRTGSRSATSTPSRSSTRSTSRSSKRSIPANPKQRGGEVYLKLGKGHYIYTSYAWFRQLPAGVPGAYRLFANLLSLPKADASATTAAAR